MLAYGKDLIYKELNMAINPIINAQLKNFKEMNPNENLSEADSFEVMSIFSVENGILSENIDPFRVHLKGAEFGIDGIAIYIQGSLCTDIEEAKEILSHGKNHTAEFHFFQSKTSDKLDYGNISKFLDAINDFFTDQNLFIGSQLEELSDIKDEIYSKAAKTSPILRCFYCTTGSGQIASPIQTLIDSNKERLNELNIFDEIHIECPGAKVIQNGFRSATNSSSAKLNFQKAVTMPSHDKVDEAYIGYVPASEILGIVLGEEDNEGNRHINKSLFYDNVRDFNPESDINKAIIAEINSGDGSDFVFKNNGITVVSKSIDRKSDTFTLEDYQIINGCQTTNILAHMRAKVENISVPLRLIGCSDVEFVSNVIIGTNQQNEVREDQFWALRPFMKDLEEYSSAQVAELKIYIERRDNQYRDIQIERTRILKPTDLMKVVAAMFFYQPNRAARDYRGIRKEFSSKIFSEDHNVELYHLAGLALYKFDYLIRTGKVDRSRAIYKYYALYALVRIHKDKPDLLEATSKTQKPIINFLTTTLKNHEQFAKHIEQVANSLETIIERSGITITAREKVRDHIRTESFVAEFDKELTKK